MNLLSRILLALSTHPPTLLFAFNEPRNLLKDFELNSPKEIWNCTRHVERKSIESFEGLADPLYYLAGKDGAVLKQTVAVKKNTWYTMSFLFRARGEYGQDKIYAYNLFAGFLAEGESNIWNGKETRSFGGTRKWTRGTIFFNSGTNQTVTPFIAFLGNGEWDVGRIYLRETTPDDFRKNTILDPGFEQSSPGMVPVEFRRTGQSRNFKISVCQGDHVRTGKQAMEVHFTGRCQLVGGRFLAKSGDSFKTGIYLKASKPVFATLFVTGTVPGNKIRRTRKLAIGPAWTRLDVEGVIPSKGESVHTLQLYLSFETQEKDAGVVVWGDDASFEVISAQERSVNMTRPRIWNDSFETGPYGWKITFFEDPRHSLSQTRALSLDTATSGHGSSSLKIQKSAMPASLKKKLAVTSLPLRLDNQKEYVFSFMAKADRPTTISAAFPYKGIGSFKLTEQWQRFTSRPVKPNRWYIRPGWNEIRITSPLDGSTIWLDAIMLEAGSQATPFRPAADCEAGIFFSEPYKLFPLDEKHTAQIAAVSYEKDLKGSVELRISDLFGKVLFQESRPISLQAGRTLRWSREVPTGRTGYFRAEIRLLDSSRKERAKNITTYAVLAPPRELPYEKSWCGILGGIDNSGRKGSTAADLALMGASLDETLDAIRLVGYKWIRIMGIGNWRNTEPVRGTYEWKWDEYLTALKRHRFGVLAEFLSHDAQPWSNSGVTVKEVLQGGFHYTARAEDVAKFTADFARRYRGKLDSINLMNETNGYPPEEYLKIAEAVYQTFKKEAPEVLVQGPGYPAMVLPLLSGKDNTWITRALKLGLNKYNDIMGIHCYSPGHAHSLSSIMRDSVELLLTNQNMSFAEMRRLQVEKFKREYRNNRIWDTESGAIFNTVAEWMNSPAETRLPWYTEQVAAARMIRWNILRMAMGVERHFHFMFLFAAGISYHTLDLMNIDGTPRAGVAPLSTFYRLFDGSRFLGRVPLGGTTHLYVFRDFDGKAIAACWEPVLENKPQGKIRFPKSAAIMEVLDFTGNPLQGKNGEYPLGAAPIYLKSALSPEQFREELKKSKSVLESFRSALSVVADSRGKLLLEATAQNTGTEKIEKLKITLSDKRTGSLKNLSPGEKKHLRFPLKESATGTLSIEADFYGNNSRQHAALNKKLFRLDSARKPAVADGVIGKEEYSTLWNREFIRTGRGQTSLLSIKLYASWLPDRIQLAAEVIDSTYVPAKKGEEVSLGDGVEVYLDFSPGKDPFSPLYPEDAIRISVNPAFPEKPSFERNGLPAKSAVSFFDFEKIKALSRRTNEGYLVELEIPMKQRLRENQLLGFNFTVMDHGNVPKPNQGLSLARSTCWNNVLAFELLQLKTEKDRKP